MSKNFTYSVVLTCYNPLPILDAAFQVAYRSTGPETEFILVDNHPPWEGVSAYVANLDGLDGRVRVLDPGRNLGSHVGSNFGAKESRGEYLIKLDDDQVVPESDWLGALRQALDQIPNTAYLSLPFDPVLPGLQANIVTPNYAVALDPGFIAFGVTIFRRELWEKDFIFTDPRLYGYEDVFCYNQAQQLSMHTGYLVSHPSQHLQHSDLHPEPLYGAYKAANAHGFTSLDYLGWLQKGSWTAEFEQVLALIYSEAEIQRLREMFSQKRQKRTFPFHLDW